MIVVGCSGGDPTEVGRSAAALVGDEYTVTTAEGEEDENGNFASSFALPVGPPPGDGIPSTVDPADYALCGIAALSGYFDDGSGARIVINGTGHYEMSVTQSATARAAGRSDNTMRVRCARLSLFANVPPNEEAFVVFDQVSHTAGSGLLFGENYFWDSGFESACLWQGFTGAISFLWSGDPAEIARVGAFEETSAACISTPGSSCAYALNSRTVAQSYEGTMTSQSACVAYGGGFLWTEHPAANQQLLRDGDFTGALEDDNFCIIAGIVGGGVIDSADGGFFSISLDPALPPPPYAGPLQYGAQASWDRISGSVAAWAECYPLAQ